MFRKKNIFLRKSFLRNVEARVLPYSVLFLLLSVVICGWVFHMDQVVIAAYATDSETFEGDTVGQYPTSDWYTYDVMAIEDTSLDGVLTNVSDYNSGTWTKTINFDTSVNGPRKTMCMFNLSSPLDNISFVTWDMMNNISNSSVAAAVTFGNWSGGTYDNHEFVTVKFKEGNITYNGSENTILLSQVAGVWYHFNVSLNWSTSMYRLGINDTDYGNWTPYEVSEDDMSFISLLDRSDTDWAEAWFDNLTVIRTAEADASSNYTLGGLDVNDRITFSGEADSTVWSNESDYDAGYQMYVYSEVNVSENCSDVYINFNSSNIGTIPIANNLYFEVSDDNVSWTGDVYTVTSNSANVSLNQSAQAWCHIAGDLFPISNGDGNVTLYLRFKLDIPVGTDAGTYTTDSWIILFKSEEI